MRNVWPRLGRYENRNRLRFLTMENRMKDEFLFVLLLVMAGASVLPSIISW